MLMVHGLNSDAMCFWELQRYLEQSGQYQSFQLFRADYEPTNCSYFRVNERVVQRGISILKRACAFNGYMIDKVDLVGHSMGGILSRLHVQYVDNTNVHKVITLNTPHTGSPLRNIPCIGHKPRPKGTEPPQSHHRPGRGRAALLPLHNAAPA